MCVGQCAGGTGWLQAGNGVWSGDGGSFRKSFLQQAFHGFGLVLEAAGR